MFNLMVGMVIGGAIVWVAKDKIKAKALAWYDAVVAKI
jgi:hypothetical protein